MEKRYVKDGQRALHLLSCQSVEALRVGKDWHLSAVSPRGGRVYLRSLDELHELILLLSVELRGR